MRWMIWLLFATSPLAAATSTFDFLNCYRVVEQNLFNEVAVKEAMGLHPEIDQGQWNPAVRDLKTAAIRVPGLVRTQAAQMKPNPFSRPAKPDVAMKLLYDTQYAVFRDVMHANYVTNDTIIWEMFNYLKESVYTKNKACFEKMQEPAPKKGQKTGKVL